MPAHCARIAIHFLLLILLLTTMAVTGSAEEEPGIAVPPGFRVERYADDDLAHDIHSLTIDSQGRVVVSGPGYVRILIDSDNDGKADTFRQFADGPATGSQGMFFHGSSLLCAGDDGLLIFRDENRDDIADGPPEVFLKIAAGGEHHVHSIQRGPDGWWYVIAGNFSGVTSAYATLPTSPVRNPVSGTLLRLKPDLSGVEIVADGMRNAYDFAFNATGDIFTFDSDDERDISLPWYLPTQVFQLLPMSNAGYLTAGLKRPGHYPDMPPVLATFGRGSPTGVVCYQHTQFPEAYRGAIFVQDWTLGRILMVGLESDGAGWKGRPQEFARGQNQFGFAPTDMEVGPDGSLYVSVGGRGTRGGVFRITHESGSVAVPRIGTAASAEERLRAVLDSPQPGSGWSRTRWQPLARSLGAAPFAAAAQDETRRVSERLRAIEILVEMFGGVDGQLAAQLRTSTSPLVRSRTAWAIGRTSPEKPPADSLKPLLQDRDGQVRRAALEALAGVADPSGYQKFLNEIAQCLAGDDRLVRYSAALLVHRMSDPQRDALRTALLKHPRGLLWFSMGNLLRTTKLSPAAADVAVSVMTTPDAPETLRMDAVRVLQLALGDVGPAPGRPPMFDGYAPRASLDSVERELNPLMARVYEVFPTGNARLDHELIRVISMVAPPNRDVFAKLMAGISDESLPADDIHRLAAVSRISIERSYEESVATAGALVGIDVKIRRLELKQDLNWDDRIGELYKALCSADPAMPSVITSQPGFGQPGHVLFMSQVPQETVAKGIEGFVATIRSDPDYTWTNDVVFAIGESGLPEHQTLLLEQLDNFSVRDAVLILLADSPTTENRKLYLSGLESSQLNAVEACVRALTRLPRNSGPEEQYQLLSAARRLQNDAREFQIRETVIRLLENNLGQTVPFVFGSDGHKPQPEALHGWQRLLEERFPDYRPVSATDISARILGSLNSVAWDSGDMARGQKLFERLGCAKCHGGRRALGPDLTGVARRFSREDLFAAIVEPDRDVSPRYQTTTIVTKSGIVYSGLIVYQSADGLLLRDAEHRTYRIEAPDIESRHVRRTSLMPAGLLRETTPEDLADLYRYLQSL